MIQLFRNGVLIEVGNDDRGSVFAQFEQSVVKWNDEFSGWTLFGDFLRIAFVPDVPEYSPTAYIPGTDPDLPVPQYLGE